MSLFIMRNRFFWILFIIALLILIIIIRFNFLSSITHIVEKPDSLNFKVSKRCELPEIKLPINFSFDLNSEPYSIDSSLIKYNFKRVKSCTEYLFSQKTEDFLEKSLLGYAYTPQEEKINASPFGIISSFKPYTIVAFGYDYAGELINQRIELQVFKDKNHLTDKLIVADFGIGECTIIRQFSFNSNGQLNIEINSGCYDIENDTLAENYKYELVFQFNTKTGKFDKQQYRCTKVK